MRRMQVGVVLALVFAGSAALAAEVGFVEQFSLADDRTVPLKELIPGTEDYYYYHCLHFQNTGRLDDVEQMLAAWIKRYDYTPRVREIQNRQALLWYEKDPKKSLGYITRQLGLHFDHQREILGRKPDQPTALDQNLISRATLTQRAMLRYKNLSDFEDSAFDLLVTMNLNGDQRRDLLRRLQRPDYPNIAKLVVDDLKHPYSGGFGSHPVHRQLLLAQLDECLILMPNLLNETNFVHTYVTKLRPAADVDWEHDEKAREAYLDTLWSFVQRLAPAHNSLRAHVLYQRLVHDRAKGVFDKDRFMEYIKLPRYVPYIAEKYMERAENRDRAADLNADYRAVTMLPIIGTDEPLVRSYLEHFFVQEDSYDPYMTYIRDTYLKEVFAETKIVNALGDMEKWYSMLSPSQYQALKERIDLDFAPTNKTTFAADEPVSLTLLVKNVQTLIVKVYEINAFNYYRERLKEVGTDVNLDGLVANEETVHKYDEPALRRVKRTFDFPALKKRGVYVVEFIGNGRSSRALVRKGQLRFIERPSTAGHVFTVLDEKNRTVIDAALWLAGHKYEPDKEGAITAPYSNSPGRQAIILCQGDFASLDWFDHQAEQYQLVAGFHVEREALLPRKKAHVLVRPSLALNRMPVTLSVLENPTLVIQSVDRDGVSTLKEVKDFKLFEEKESVYEFQVPERLAALRFTLKAKVQNLSRNEKVDLSGGAAFSLNGIDQTEKVEDLHVAHVGDEYVLELLGKTGEVKANRPIILDLKHRDFREPVHVVLQSDEKGHAALGALKDIVRVQASGPEGTSHVWLLRADAHNYPAVVHGAVGDVIHVPYMGRQTEPAREAFSLLETRGGTYVKEYRELITVKGGFLDIQGLPAGDFSLLLKESGTNVTLRISDGEARQGYVLSDNRLLETRNRSPLQIVSVTADKDDVKVQLANSSKFTRVHVLGTRFLPAYPAYGDLGVVSGPEPELVALVKPESLYLSGRDIGDEYRYILERKYAKKYPGNMLKRPSLLLNPWALRKTETGVEYAREGEAWGAAGGERRGGRAGYGAVPAKPWLAAEDVFSSLDFLAEPGAVLANLVPDEKGLVTIKRKDLATRQQLHVIAVDPESTACRELTVGDPVSNFKDLRLRTALDSKKHYTEQNQVSIIPGDKKFALADITTSQFEAYDSLAKVYKLYATLSGDANLTEFGFILGWPKLKPEEKQEKYSKYACHELNFFLYRKDPDFFKKAVLPYLKNKKDKTFLDEWLIGADLSGYLKPWAFGQLNAVERVLLAQALKAEQKPMERHTRELWELIPPDIERYNFLFRTALKGSALETGDLMLGLEAAKGKLANGRAGVEMLRKLDHAGGLEAAATPARPSVEAPAEPAAPPPADMRPEESKKELKDVGRAEKEEEGYYARDDVKRTAVRQLYRRLDKTEEWAENNYYHLPIETQNAGLVTVNSFWRDYAAYAGDEPFFSANLAEASRNFTEMMFALAVLDLPFEAKEHKTVIDGAQFTLTAGSSMVVYHREIREAEDAKDKPPILVSQNFFRHGDRYRYVDNEQVDKYVTDEFIVHTVYGCQVVVTNPTSSKQKLDVLVQVPLGAIPVLNAFYTRSLHIDLEPYSARTFEYHFYFPAAGDYPQYPVHLAKNEKLVASCAAVTLKVVEVPTKIDKTSWDYVSQHGTDDEVITYLDQNNLGRLNLDRIAFRMRAKEYFDKVSDLLSRRHAYNHTLWSYAIYHDATAAAREYLQHSPFAMQCGAYVDTKLLTIDPVVRRTYQHLEYSPLVNARAHKLGKTRTILNNRLYAQYAALMTVLSCRPKLDDTDLMAVTYYLLLQDRVEEAAKFFARVNPANLAAKLQYDYFKAYVDLFSDAPKVARATAEKYADHPVDRWRNLFADVLSQLDEIEGKGPKVVDTQDRTQVQTRLAATEPSFDFAVEAKTITVNYQNLTSCTVNYYLMDIELLFSRNPFVQSYSGQFAYIRPNETQTVKLPERRTTLAFELPEKFHNSNVMVEIIAGGVKKSQPYYSYSMALQVVENYGQLRVSDQKTAKPMPRVYVKVYAQMRGGRIQFYKDGYTDLRGRFDYTSLNTNELEAVEKFSLLIMSDTAGAVIREAAPPKR